MADRLLQGGGGGVPSHDPDTETPSEVYVNGTRIPVGDVDVHTRKEGPLDVTRFVEAEFASPYDGVEYTDAFKTLSPSDQSSPDMVRVDVRDRMSGEYHTGFYGLVTGVGSSASGGESWWRFRAQGPGHLLKNLPASKRFERATLEDILGYVVDVLNDNTPFDVSLGVTADAQPLRTGSPDTSSDGSRTFTGIAPSSGTSPNEIAQVARQPVQTSKTFQYGKHMLSDVVSWVSEKLNLYTWMIPTEDGATLTAQRNPPINEHRAHYLDGGDTFVENNDALSELKPVNTVVVKAPAKKSVKDVNKFQVNERGEQIVAVKARHSTLYRRAGGNELHAQTQRLSDAMTKEEVENEARKLLKDAIDDTTEGDMQTLLRSPITPYDTIEAKPTCDGESSRDFEPLTYEVSRVHHKIKGSGIPETRLNVGISTDGGSDIEIIDSWQPEGTA